MYGIHSHYASVMFNPNAPREAKIIYNECNRVKEICFGTFLTSCMIRHLIPDCNLELGFGNINIICD